MVSPMEYVKRVDDNGNRLNVRNGYKSESKLAAGAAGLEVS